MNRQTVTTQKDRLFAVAKKNILALVQTTLDTMDNAKVLQAAANW